MHLVPKLDADNGKSRIYTDMYGFSNNTPTASESQTIIFSNALNSTVWTVPSVHEPSERVWRHSIYVFHLLFFRFIVSVADL